MEEKKYVWSISTGRVSILSKKSRKAAEFMTSQEGFEFCYPTRSHTLWFYTTENNAKGARNLARTQGIVCGKNICRFRREGNTVIFDDPYFNEQEGNK